MASLGRRLTTKESWLLKHHESRASIAATEAPDTAGGTRRPSVKTRSAAGSSRASVDESVLAVQREVEQRRQEKGDGAARASFLAFGDDHHTSHGAVSFDPDPDMSGPLARPHGPMSAMGTESAAARCRGLVAPLGLDEPEHGPRLENGDAAAMTQAIDMVREGVVASEMEALHTKAKHAARLNAAASRVQSLVRTFVTRRRYERHVECLRRDTAAAEERRAQDAAVRVQTVARGLVARLRYRQLRESAARTAAAKRERDAAKSRRRSHAAAAHHAQQTQAHGTLEEQALQRNVNFVHAMALYLRGEFADAVPLFEAQAKVRKEGLTSTMTAYAKRRRDGQPAKLPAKPKGRGTRAGSPAGGSRRPSRR